MRSPPLLWSTRHERAGFKIYGSGVVAAREPFLYTDLGVPDTVDGRFEMVGLYTFLIIQRLKCEIAPGPELAQAVFDAMFSDMDVNLREMGVGDLSVGRKIRIMWEAFHGRAVAYGDAMITGDISNLQAALCRNVWRGIPPTCGSSQALSRVILAQQAHLFTKSLEVLNTGTIDFLSAQDVAVNCTI